MDESPWNPRRWRYLRTQRHHKNLHPLAGISDGFEKWGRFHCAPMDGKHPQVKGQAGAEVGHSANSEKFSLFVLVVQIEGKSFVWLKKCQSRCLCKAYSSKSSFN